MYEKLGHSESECNSSKLLNCKAITVVSLCLVKWQKAFFFKKQKKGPEDVSPRKSKSHFKKLSEFKNISFKVSATPWIIAKGKEHWLTLQLYKQISLTARYMHRLFLSALLYQLTANQQLKQKKVSEKETSAAITYFLSCAKSFKIITAKESSSQLSTQLLDSKAGKGLLRRAEGGCLAV